MQEIINLKEPLIQTCNELLSLFGINCNFIYETPEIPLNSDRNINVFVGLTQGLKGIIALELTKETALTIVSGMMAKMTGRKEVTGLNEIEQSALSEFMNILCGNTLSKVNLDEVIDIMPPVFTTEKKVFSGISFKKIFFKAGDMKFNIAYYLE